MPKIFAGLLCLFVALPAVAYQAPDLKPMLARLEAACPDYATLYPYSRLRELQGVADPKDWQIFMELDATQWVGIEHVLACKRALLQNIMDGMAFVIDQLPESSPWRNSARLSGATAMLKYAVSVEPADKAALLDRANAQMREFIAKEANPKALRSSQAHYFAAHAYIDAAGMARQGSDADALLAQAVAIAREGLAKAQDTTEIVEPLGIALGEQAKRLTPGTDAYVAKVKESTAVFEAMRGKDPLAAYNIAVNDVLLGDFGAARKELGGMAAAGAVDGQVCGGLVADKDLQALRTNDPGWFKAFATGQCQGFIRKLPSPAAAAKAGAR